MSDQPGMLPEGVLSAVRSAQDWLDQGVPLYELPRRLILAYETVYPTMCDAFYRLGHAAAWRDEQAALRHIWGNPPTADSAVAAALYAIMRFPGDSDSAVGCVERYAYGAALAAHIIKTLE